MAIVVDESERVDACEYSRISGFHPLAAVHMVGQLFQFFEIASGWLHYLSYAREKLTIRFK